MMLDANNTYYVDRFIQNFLTILYSYADIGLSVSLIHTSDKEFTFYGIALQGETLKRA